MCGRKKHWAACIQQIGFYQMVSISAVFANAEVQNYYGNTSFSTNKGDGLCLNVGLSYAIPFYAAAPKSR